MSCFKIEMIQKYIDGEASSEEATLIEMHVSDCEKCAAEVEQQKRLSAGIKKAIGLITIDNQEIPAFVAPAPVLLNRLKTIKKVVYFISAACILLFAIIFMPKNESENKHQIAIIHSVGPEVDANKPVTKQEIIIYVIDENGNVTEHHFN
jgi:hypothetical protein